MTSTTGQGHIPGSHIADPGPLGLGAFALTTFLLSIVNTGLIEAEPVVFGVAFALGGIAQFTAGIVEFFKGNTFGATAFCAYGAFWLSFWYLTGFTDLSGLDANAVGNGVGLYLLAWGIFTLYMMVAALRTNRVLLTTFILLTITFFLLAIGDFSQVEVWTKLGGWTGVATAAMGFYGSFAVVANSTFREDKFPVGPLSR